MLRVYSVTGLCGIIVLSLCSCKPINRKSTAACKIVASLGHLYFWLSMMTTFHHSYITVSPRSLFNPPTLQQEHLFPVQITTDTPSSYPVLVFVSPFSSPEVKNVHLSVWVTVVVVPRGWDFPDNSLIPRMAVFAISFPVFNFLLLSNPLSTPPFICFSFLAS